MPICSIRVELILQNTAIIRRLIAGYLKVLECASISRQGSLTDKLTKINSFLLHLIDI